MCIRDSRYPVAGLLRGDLSISEPFGDFVAALRQLADDDAAVTDTALSPELFSRAAALLDGCSSELSGAAGPPVLLHGDFKASNLHWTHQQELLVLDWEFAYAGSALMDVGQLTRWSPPAAFVDAFEHGYLAGGGHLPDDWLRWAAVMDLVNLFGLARGLAPHSPRAADVARRIQTTLDAFPSF